MAGTRTNQQRAIGRPKDYDERTTTALRIPPELLRQVKDAAAEREISTNLLITKAIEDFLPRLIPVAELRLARDA